MEKKDITGLFRNNFILFINLIFRLKDTIKKIENKKIEGLKKEYDEKLIFLHQEKDNRLIRGCVEKIPSIFIGSVPIEGIEDFHYTSREAKQEMFKISFFNTGLPLEAIKKEAAARISEEIVKSGFLKTTIEGNNINFHINYFQF
jgi:hypothetical protein